MEVFDVTLKFVREVVDHFWTEGDAQLVRWWAGFTWGPFHQVCQELSRETLSRMLATLCVRAGYLHDLAHSPWTCVNHPYHVTHLRRGDRSDPSTYLPDRSMQIKTRFLNVAFMSDDLTTPLNAYKEAFPEASLRVAVASYQEGLQRILGDMDHIYKFGSMTH